MSELAQQIEAAFSHRGNVTLHLQDGGAIECFLFNRDLAPHPTLGTEPFVEIFLESGAREKLRVADLKSVELTGKDHAAPWTPPSA